MTRKDRAPAAKGGRGLSSSASDQPITVTQLASSIESAIRNTFPTKVRVIGEISSVTNRTHYYFTLKDDSATISAVLFASAARKQRTPPTHGHKVIATGKLDYYAPNGRLSLIIDKLEPVGEGDLEQRYKALCEDLRARGWFDPLTKQPLPIFPRTIAIITSETSAALQDVLDTASRRCPAVNMLVVDARVQGDLAKSQIARAINRISNEHEQLGLDAIILTRGGGSLEDLWAFNEPIVANAIHDCTIPIVAAIGHETDTTIAELVADERAATPTQAAMKLVPDREALREQLESLTKRITRELSTTLSSHTNHLNRLATTGPLANPSRLIEPSANKLAPLRHRLQSSTRAMLGSHTRTLDALAIRLAKHQPAAVHATRREHIAGLTQRLSTAIRTNLSRHVSQLNAAQRELNAIGPRQVLSRGYSLTTSPDGTLLRDASSINPGDQLTTHLHDGQITSTVNGDKKSTPSSKPKATKKRTKKPKDQTPPGPSLFS